MTLRELIQDLSPLHMEGNSDCNVNAVCIDSRQVKKGDVFIALRGTQADGHLYVDKAIAAGASAVVVESMPDKFVAGVCYVQLTNTSSAAGLMSSRLQGNPSTKMRIVGVTGTNGKTTIATLLYRCFKQRGYKVGLLSTVCNYIDEEIIPSTHTTPNAVALQALLARMKTVGCSHVFMEVSSHAVDQQRIAGIDFDGAIFTNLTRDHLDYHETMQKYIEAKKGFFDNLKPEAFALVNVDDKRGAVMLQNCAARHYCYALKQDADYRAKVIALYPDATDVVIDGQEITLRLVGDFNVYNALAVYAASRLLGMSREEAATSLSALEPVSGRFQTISSHRGYTAVVDYAHTPDALVNVLSTLRTLMQGKGQLICVVGAGGDRDRGKRPVMAREAASLSDRLILTSDNPRSEKPEDIIEEMKQGLDSDSLARTLSILDRAEAIRTACMLAQPSDFVLVAGKGHETYQEIDGKRHHFDDREVLREFMDNQ
ncbi:UDP-N-acetylmuramoylalanyl-D-glutamate--2,6-diaminopimelate ligase [Porphyromonas crevioricanis]|uniref:UDP-N-acetylmuramoyl-L-alanyl-D-glutamate--2, 6-diaminopimelate ligase n=1 Tax=Porphyromonas crevioricanis TaxID=393921 RepID=UPI00052D0821|nr:UDP-N-acetylmuramoyl-L-alanyl-D-glutamate--2,6-diaminopimelate ligase [Porphyromonas crevioricanis]KGN90283.1 UDP-N-acetylmuramoylalanyl-D-glutamate--2,6-diaminopimelate ligase [Porphyromonas crevioricanis]